MALSHTVTSPSSLQGGSECSVDGLQVLAHLHGVQHTVNAKVPHKC